MSSNLRSFSADPIFLLLQKRIDCGCVGFQCRLAKICIFLLILPRFVKLLWLLQLHNLASLFADLREQQRTFKLTLGKTVELFRSTRDNCSTRENCLANLSHPENTSATFSLVPAGDNPAYVSEEGWNGHAVIEQMPPCTAAQGDASRIRIRLASASETTAGQTQQGVRKGNTLDYGSFHGACCTQNLILPQ